FLPYRTLKLPEGIGCYCLYHGNLSIAENEKAARWLIKEVFHDLKVPFVITGKNPSPSLEKLAHGQVHTCIVANPGEKEMQDMITKAQVNILPSYNDTGVKLKLLNALYNGRHCVVNESTVKGSGLDAACHIASNAQGFKSIVSQLYHQPLGEEEYRLRSHLLQHAFDNKKNAERLIAWIW
ncbi:MAG TPA: glycosyltransferase family 4 protein, partial [Flavitalea sp.]|nr:glycosyltransferase family 4 protein [Flavitalea sp.]